MEGRIKVPLHSAGLAAQEVMRRVAERLWETGKKAALDAMPDAVTLSERYEDGKHVRVAETPDGRRWAVSYDYREKTVGVARRRGKRKEREDAV